MEEDSLKYLRREIATLRSGNINNQTRTLLTKASNQIEKALSSIQRKKLLKKPQQSYQNTPLAEYTQGVKKIQFKTSPDFFNEMIKEDTNLDESLDIDEGMSIDEGIMNDRVSPNPPPIEKKSNKKTFQKKIHPLDCSCTPCRFNNHFNNPTKNNNQNNQSTLRTTQENKTHYCPKCKFKSNNPFQKVKELNDQYLVCPNCEYIMTLETFNDHNKTTKIINTTSSECRSL